MPKKGHKVGKQEPASFLVKTYKILENQRNSPYACWLDDGIAFSIPDVAGFSTHILPTYFKHSNFSSFVRQLNMYDFHKRKDRDKENIFYHPNFRAGFPEELRLIKRKIPSPEDGIVVPLENDIETKQTELQEWCKRVALQNEQICKENQALRQKLNQVVDQRNTQQMMILYFLRSQDKYYKNLPIEMVPNNDECQVLNTLPMLMKQFLKKGIKAPLTSAPVQEEPGEMEESREVIPASPILSLCSLQSQIKFQDSLNLSVPCQVEESVDNYYA